MARVREPLDLSGACYYRIVADDSRVSIEEEIGLICSGKQKIMPASLVVPSLKARTYMDMPEDGDRWKGKSGWKFNLHCPAVFHATAGIFSHLLLQDIPSDSDVLQVLRSRIDIAKQSGMFGVIKGSLQEVLDALDKTSLTEHGLNPGPDHIEAIVVAQTPEGVKQAIIMQEVFFEKTGIALPFVVYQSHLGQETQVTKEQIVSSLSEDIAFEKAKTMISFGGGCRFDSQLGIVVSEMTASEKTKLQNFLTENGIANFEGEGNIIIRLRPSDFVQRMDSILQENTATMSDTLKTLYRSQEPLESEYVFNVNLRHSKVEFSLPDSNSDRVSDIKRFLSMHAPSGLETNTQRTLGFNAYSMLYKFEEMHEQFRATFPRVFQEQQRETIVQQERQAGAKR